MPYDQLPARLRNIIPSENGQSMFRQVVNNQLERGKSESVAFASAWAALERAGYAKDDEGMWVKKSQPTVSQVHTPSADWDDEDEWDEDEELTKAETYTPPVAARNAAKRVLAWKEKYGDEVKGMTPVGWARARQLASGKPVSRRTVARMSAFARHRQNAKIDPKFKGEPWRDRGYVAWLGWGGTSGVGWANRVMQKLEKRATRAKREMNDDAYTTPAEAVARSMDLGLEGEIHVWQTADGQMVYMPGEDHDDYLEAMAEAAGIETDEDDEADSEDSGEGLLERTVTAIMQAAMTYEMNKSHTILKADEAQRIVWGWASVATEKGELVVDQQGDTMTPDEMVKMANGFMESVRTAKAMHEGESIGEVIHSLPLTKELAKAFGIETDREGWIIGMKIKDDDVWKSVLANEFSGFSIGGRAAKREAIQ